MDIIENQIIPTYYDNKLEWARMMRQAVRTAEAYFNSDRMVIEYFNRIYKPIAHESAKEGGLNPDASMTSDPSAHENPNMDAWTYSNIK